MNRYATSYRCISQMSIVGCLLAFPLHGFSGQDVQTSLPVEGMSALALAEADLDRDMALIQEASKNAPPMVGTYRLHERKTARMYLRNAPDPFAMESVTITGQFREIPSEGLFELRGATYDRPDDRAGRVVQKFFLLFDNGHVSSRRLWKDPISGERMASPGSEDSSQAFNIPDSASGPASGRWIAASFFRQRLSGRTTPKPFGLKSVTSERSLHRIEQDNRVVYFGSHKVGFPGDETPMKIDERLEISLDANPRILVYFVSSSWPHVVPERPFREKTVAFEYAPVSDGSTESLVLSAIRSEEVYFTYNEAGVPSISEPDGNSLEVSFTDVRAAPELRSDELEYIGTKLPLHRSNRPVNR